MSMISYDTARKLFVFRQFHTECFVNTYVQQPTTDDKSSIDSWHSVFRSCTARRTRSSDRRRTPT